MRAKAARKLYFEDYVMFESVIISLAEICIPDFQIKDENLEPKKLKAVIEEFAHYNISNQSHLRINTWWKQRKVRNWLAHKNSNSNVPQKYLFLMERIKKDLQRIIAFKKMLKKSQKQDG